MSDPQQMELGTLLDLLGEAAVLLDDGGAAPTQTLRAIYRDVVHDAMDRLRSTGAVPSVSPAPQEPSVICLSGSSRFIDAMAVIAWELEKRGHVTMHCNLLPGWYTQTPHHLAEEQGVAERLDAVHLRKIDIANELLVIDIGGYIGESTRREIAYATDAGKRVRYLSHDQELLALLPKPSAVSTPDLSQLIATWEENAKQADRWAVLYEAKLDGANAHAFRKERRIWTTCVNNLKALLAQTPRQDINDCPECAGVPDGAFPSGRCSRCGRTKRKPQPW